MKAVMNDEDGGGWRLNSSGRTRTPRGSGKDIRTVAPESIAGLCQRRCWI